MGIKLFIKKSAVDEIRKSVGSGNLEALKKEVIAILKKHENDDIKKAIEFFMQDESRYTHLEKSLNGDWIEKAGYGVGTIRIWKGKKYKKISASPTRWVRVFDKEDRGAKSSMTRLINRVKACQDAEELYKFCLSNHSLFQDDNGVDLPIMDKLRAAIDNQKKKVGDELDSSKHFQKPVYKNSQAKEPMENKESEKTTIVSDEELKTISDKLLNKRFKELGEIIPTIKDDEIRREYNENYKNFQKEIERRNAAEKTPDSKVLSNGKTIKEVREKYGIKTEENKEDSIKMSDQTKRDIEEFKPLYNKITKLISNSKYSAWSVKNGKELLEKENSELEELQAEQKEGADKSSEIKKVQGLIEEIKKYNDSPLKEILDAQSLVNDWEKQMDKYKDDPDTAAHYKKYRDNDLESLKKDIEKYESEAEKRQNRSDAMKGNKNAYKGKEEMEKMPLEELESYKDELYQKYIHIDVKNKKELGDARLAYREALDIWRDRISKSGEVQSEFKNRLMNKLMDMMHGSEPLYVEQWNLKEMSDGNLKRYIEGAEKWKDKGIVHLADPIIKKFEESKKEMFDNNDFVGPALDRDFYAISHSKVLENMKKELELRKNATPEKKTEIKEETKNDEPIKKQETSLNPFEPSESNNINEMKPIASNKKIGENEVIMPYSKELNAEIKSLNNCVSQDPNREFMQHVYYSKGNLVATDGRRLKTIKVGELESIPDGSYVDVTSNKTGINIKKLDLDGTYPAYEKVIPDKLHQKVTLDNDTLKEKIKSMYADGAIEKKGTNLVQLEFKDGKVFIDDTPVGDAFDIKLKANVGDWMSRRNEDTNYVSFNAQYLINALSGKRSVLMMSDAADKAMAISTNSTTNVLMPMQGSNEKVDYSGNRQAKSDENDTKNKMRIINKKKLDDYLNSFNFDENQIDKVKNSIKNAGHQESDEGMIKRAYEALKDVDKLLKSPPSKYMSESKYQTNKYGFMILAMANKDPEVRTLLEDAAKKYGVDVRKSIFDLIDFDFEEDSESDFDDYDASQPELFNSTQYKVADALNSVFGC